jgi:hypothetical protein
VGAFVRTKIKLERDTVTILKVLVTIIILGLLLLFLSWLTDFEAGAAEPPPQRELTMLLLPEGLIYDPITETYIGFWSAQNLEGNRNQRGQLRSVRTITMGGENLFFAYKRQPPSRLGMGASFRLASIEYPGTEWAPVGREAIGWEQDGVVLGILVRLEMKGTDNGSIESIGRR